MNIIGNGGLAKQIKDVIDSFNSFSITYSGRIRGWFTSEYEDPDAPYVIGYSQLPNRETEFMNLVNQDKCVGTIIAPSAHVSPDVAGIGPGTVVLHEAFIGPGAKTEENVLIATRAIVEHDSIVEAHSVILTGAIINGGCIIGQRCTIGAGAILLPNVIIANDVTIGAGCVVTKNIEESGTYVGCPAKKVKS